MLWCVVAFVLLNGAFGVKEEPLPDYEDMYSFWPGPTKGCESSNGLGRLEVACALPAGRVTFQLDINNHDLMLTCEDGVYNCSEFEEARHLLAEAPGKTPEVLARVSIVNCALAGPLTCVLDVINATDVTSLMLKNVKNALQPVHLRGLKALTKLRMHDVGKNITSVPYETLSLLPSLESFVMWGGMLSLSSEPRITLPHLTHLELASGGLKFLPAHAFTNTPALTKLLLFGNKIETVHEDALYGLSQLQTLSFNNNLLREIPTGLLRHCPQLRLFHVFLNRLERVRAGTFDNLTALEEINIMRNNDHMELDEKIFAGLPALKTLNLDSNGIDTLPVGLLDATSLESLSLQGNKLTELPDSLLRRQTRLKKLNLSFNNLERLPAGVFADLYQLNDLNLARNRLQKLHSSSLVGLSALLALDISNNNLTTLPVDTFDGLRSLQELSAGYNGLRSTEYHSENSYNTLGSKSLPVDYISPFRGLLQLKRLKLKHNHFHQICEDWRFLLYLEELDLSYNEVTELTDVDLDFLSPATVDLRHNKITSVIPNIYSELPNKKPKFLLGNNPYSCDCTLYPLVTLYQNDNTSDIDLENAVCSSPLEFAGSLITDMNLHALYCNYSRCPTNCSCSIRPVTSRLEVSCESMPQSILPTDYDTELTLKSLTNFSSLPAYVRFLNLSNLRLTDVPTLNTSVEMDLRHNLITKVPIELLEDNYTVYLADNPLRCDCDTHLNLLLLRKHKLQILDYANVTCAGGATLGGLLIDGLCYERYILAASAVLVGFCLILILTILFIYRRYRTEVRIILRKYGLWYTREDEHDKIYDAFVSFAHEDERFVYDKLVPALESGRRPLRLCVHSRDWRVGDWIPTQIVRSVEQSRHTIVVLSEHYARSTWALMEFRTAHARDSILVLLLTDVPGNCPPEMRAYLSTNTYIRVDDSLLWDRLRDAALRKPSAPQPVKDKLAGGLQVRLEEGKLVNAASA